MDREKECQVEECQLSAAGARVLPAGGRAKASSERQCLGCCHCCPNGDVSPSSSRAALGAFSCCSPARLLMHTVEEVQALGEIPAARPGLGMPFRKKVVPFLSLQRAFPQANSSEKQCQNLKAEKQSGLDNHKASGVWCIWCRQQEGLAAGCYWASPAAAIQAQPLNKERWEQAHSSLRVSKGKQQAD